MSLGNSKKRRYPDDGWGGGGFGAYMKKKAVKLAKQFENGASETGDDSNGKFSKIFKGVSIYVNGFTDPPASKLKKLMMMHGGRYIYYPNKSNTTHIVANNLAYTKIKELKNEKVVSPKWITDSVEAGKLLPHAPYLIYRPKASNQSLHRFAYKKRSERDKEKEGTEGNVSSLEDSDTSKSCSGQPKSSTAYKSGHTKNASNDAISDSSSKKCVSINEMVKLGECIVSSCDARKVKHKEVGLCKEKPKVLVSEQSKPEQMAACTRKHDEQLLMKEVQPGSNVKLSKLASVNIGHVGENLFERFQVAKCKNEPNKKAINKSGQGNSHMQQTKVAGSSHHTEDPTTGKKAVAKCRREVDGNAVNKQERKRNDLPQSEKGVIAQTKNSAEKNSVPKCKNDPNNEFVIKSGQENIDDVGKNLFERFQFVKCKNEPNKTLINKSGQGNNHMQQNKDVGSSHHIEDSTTGKKAVAKCRKEVDGNAINKQERKRSDLPQSKKGVIAQTKNSAEKNSVPKCKNDPNNEFVIKSGQENIDDVGKNLFERFQVAKCKNEPNKTLINKSGQGNNDMQQNKDVGSSHHIEDSTTGKKAVAKCRKEVDGNAINKQERKRSDLPQSEKGVIAQTKNSAEKNSVPKCKNDSNNEFVIKSGQENIDHVGENLFERFQVAKCKNEPNKKAINKSGQGNSHMQQTKVAGSSHHIEDSTTGKKAIAKCRREVDGNAINKQERKRNDLPQSEKGVIAQTKNFAEKNSVPKCKNDSSKKFVIKSGQENSHLQQTQVTKSRDQDRNSASVKSAVIKHRKDVDSNTANTEKRSSGLQQCKKGLIAQTENFAEKNPVQKSRNHAKKDCINTDGRESQQPALQDQKISFAETSPVKIIGSECLKPSEPFGKGPQTQSCLDIADSKSKESDPKELPISDENDDVPPIQLNNCYFPKSNDPAFLPTFYRHSSFYHLTTWRAEHKIFVKKLHEKGDRSFPGKKKLMAMFQKNCTSDESKCDNSNSAKLENLCGSENETEKPISGSQDETENGKPRMIMHIDMDAFFVAVSLLNYPELLDKPVAVAHYAAKPKKAEKVLPEKVGQFEGKSQGKGTPSRTGGLKNGRGEPSKEGQNGQQLSQVSQVRGNGAPVHPGLGMVASEADNFTSLAAIASCSYQARKSGVRNGMLMKDAKELCPELRTIPYDFDGYHRVSRLLYETIASYTHDITAASCDEVVVDITNLMRETGATAIQTANVIRKEVFEKTKCTASAGLASNVILAKLCTKAAKPNGTFLLKDKDVTDFLKKAPVGDLPGIGRAFNKKMNSLGVYTCEDLQKVELKVLQKEFGPRTGEILYQNCRGCDTQHLTADRQRKYVSVEVNYGIRFDSDDDAYQFINLLCQKIDQKMKKLGMIGRRISLKLKVRRPGTPVEDPKYMGYGVSDDKIRSISLSQETNDAGTIERTCKSLFLHMGADAKDIRGVGIQLSLLKKISKGHAISKSLTEMLPKKEDVPKSPKRLAPIEDKPKPRTYSMLDFMETKTESSPSSLTQPEYRPIRKWSGVPPLPFTMSPSQCLFPFSKVDPNSVKVEKTDCLIAGKRETVMDLWSKSVTPSRPSSARKLSLGENGSGEKDEKVESPNLSLGGMKSQEPSSDQPSSLTKNSLSLGCTPTSPKTKKPDSKCEKSGFDQPFAQVPTSSFGKSTDTPTETLKTDIKVEKSSLDQPSIQTTTSYVPVLTSVPTEFQTAEMKIKKPCPDKPFSQTAVSSFIRGTCTPTKTQQSQVKSEKSSTINVTPSDTLCTPSPMKANTSESKVEESGSDQLVIPTTASPSLGCTTTPSTTQKAGAKFQLPPPTELDLSVLRSLPPEICDQIIQEYSSDEIKDTVAIQRIKSYHPNTASTSTGITSELDQDVLQNLPPEILQEVLAEERRKVIRRMSEEKSDLGNEPSSYSEIDKSCLEALPKDLQNEICEKYKPKQLSQIMSTDVKINLPVEEEMPLSPDGKGAYSQSYEIKRTTEKLPWKRDIREVLSMQTPPSKKGSLDGEKEMGIDGENGRRNSDEEDDQGETSERKEVANEWHKEEVTNLDGAVELWDVKAKLMEWVNTFEDPLNEDISHVVHYLRTLILEQNLEMVYHVLRALKRIVSKNGRDCWKAACSTITKRIQSTIHQMYGSTLKLD